MLVIVRARSSHHVDVTQIVDPEGVQSSSDSVQLVFFKGLLHLRHGAVKARADPAVHAAQIRRLTFGNGKVKT